MKVTRKSKFLSIFISLVICLFGSFGLLIPQVFAESTSCSVDIDGAGDKNEAYIILKVAGDGAKVNSAKASCGASGLSVSTSVDYDTINVHVKSKDGSPIPATTVGVTADVSDGASLYLDKIIYNKFNNNTPTPTPTPEPTPTNTPIPTPTNTPVPTDTPTPKPTNTPKPTKTPTPIGGAATPTPAPTDTPTPTPKPTDTPTPTTKPTDTPTPTPTVEPTETSETSEETSETTTEATTSEETSESSTTESASGAGVVDPSDTTAPSESSADATSASGESDTTESSSAATKFVTPTMSLLPTTVAKKKENPYTFFIWFAIIFVLIIVIYLRYNSLSKKRMDFVEICKNFIPVPDFVKEWFRKNKSKEEEMSDTVVKNGYLQKPSVGDAQAFRPAKAARKIEKKVEDKKIDIEDDLESDIDDLDNL